MTGDPPVPDRPALWAALSHMKIEMPGGAARFEDALADQQGWALDFAERVTDEYSGFLYLAATAGFEVTPSQSVDEAWHLHLTLPHYREVLCERILGHTLEHRPATGEPEDEARCRRQYEETLALYERVFGKPPPGDIWPRPDPELEGEYPPSARAKLRKIGRGLAAASLIGSFATILSGYFVVGFVLLGAAAIFFILAQPTLAAARRTSSGCGGGCGGGASASGDDCGASCGGASCGGGGCGGGD